MHEFDIKQGFSESTVMFCKHCGKSYRLVVYTNQNPTRAAWEEVNFEDYKGNLVDLPTKPCNERPVIR